MRTLRFPLYHGTITFFNDSIMKYGLGGANPIEELKVLGCLSELEKLADEKLANNEDWVYILKYPISNITSQKNGFQHGQVYLSPCPYTAGRYSDRTHGSEAISSVFDVVNILKKNNIQIGQDLLNRFAPIMQLEYIEKKSVIYKVTDLPVDYLLMGERHEDVYEQIGKVMSIIEENGAEKI